MKLTEAGTYNATIQWPDNHAEMLITTPNGADGLELELITTCGKEIKSTCWLSEKAYEKTLSTLKKAFGFDGNWGAFAKGARFPSSDCTIVVEMEAKEYNGKTYNNPKVKWMNPRKTGSVGNTSSILSRLAALAGANGSDQAPIHQPLEEDDSIPF